MSSKKSDKIGAKVAVLPNSKVTEQKLQLYKEQYSVNRGYYSKRLKLGRKKKT